MKLQYAISTVKRKNITEDTMVKIIKTGFAIYSNPEDKKALLNAIVGNPTFAYFQTAGKILMNEIFSFCSVEDEIPFNEFEMNTLLFYVIHFQCQEVFVRYMQKTSQFSTACWINIAERYNMLEEENAYLNERAPVLLPYSGLVDESSYYSQNFEDYED